VTAASADRHFVIAVGRQFCVHLSHRRPPGHPIADVMFNQVSLPRPGRLVDLAPVVPAVPRGLLTLTVPARPARRFVPAFSESYFETGLMKRELHRL
jgi:hypothetical protein